MYICLNKHLGWMHKEVYFIKDKHATYKNIEKKIKKFKK